jgi:cellulose biosynthesis protein BcsQ
MAQSVIAIASGKGGVGKTTSVANLAVALGQRDLNVLAWDLDGQGNLGQALGVDIAQVSSPATTCCRAGSTTSRPPSTRRPSPT